MLWPLRLAACSARTASDGGGQSASKAPKDASLSRSENTCTSTAKGFAGEAAAAEAEMEAETAATAMRTASMAAR